MPQHIHVAESGSYSYGKHTQSISKRIHHGKQLHKLSDKELDEEDTYFDPDEPGLLIIGADPFGDGSVSTAGTGNSAKRTQLLAKAVSKKDASKVGQVYIVVTAKGTPIVVDPGTDPGGNLQPGEKPVLKVVVTGGSATVTAAGVSVAGATGAAGAEVAAGTVLVISATPTTPGHVATVSGYTTGYNGLPWTLTMPNAIVTINISFAPVSNPNGDPTLTVWMEPGDVIAPLTTITAGTIDVYNGEATPIPANTTVTITVSDIPEGYNFSWATRTTTGTDTDMGDPGSTNTWTFAMPGADTVVSIGYSEPPPPRPEWLEAGAKLAYNDGDLISGDGKADYWLAGREFYLMMWGPAGGPYEGYTADSTDGGSSGEGNTKALSVWASPNNWGGILQFAEDSDLPASGYNLRFRIKGGTINVGVSNDNGDIMAPVLITGGADWRTETLTITGNGNIINLFLGLEGGETVYLDKIRFITKTTP